MPRWFTLDVDYLKASGHGALIDRARSTATGTIDPAQEAIDNATARIQRAISTGNVLDVDPTKIPGSWKGDAVRLALYALQERIGMLTPTQRKDAESGIVSELNRTSDEKKKVEDPDTPAGTPTFQPTGMKAQAIGVERRMTGRRRTSGL